MKIDYQYKIDSTTTEKEIIDILLNLRKVKDKNAFLQPQSPIDISLLSFEKKLKTELQRTIKFLEEIKKNNQTIVVYTDYDADGITGGAVLWETLYLLGFKVFPYIPNRKTEGYGFSKIGINRVKKKFNPRLMISVDQGITKIEEISYARSIGIETIITDHHLKLKEVPKEALAVFHIPILSGSGVAYFFAKAIYQHFKNKTVQKDKLEGNFKLDYQAIASIGTIADLVPLIGPSRSLVKYGLQAFAKIDRVGINSLLQEAGIGRRKITPYEVGFIIAPRINAVGRLGDATDALRLLCTTKSKRAFKLANYLGEKNRLRQTMVEENLNEAEKIFSQQVKTNQPLPKIIILVSDHWHEGIIGLIASRLADKFHRPTIIFTKADGFYKASARSIKGFHITNFLRSLKDYLIDVGGHAQAAGLTVKKDRLDEFISQAKREGDLIITKTMLIKKITADFKTPLANISLSLLKKLEQLAPFGIGNRQPLFYSSVKITTTSLFGKEKNHLKMTVQDSNSTDKSLELIYFRKGSLFTKLSRNETINVVYKLQIDRWGGKEQVRGIVTFACKEQV